MLCSRLCCRATVALRCGTQPSTTACLSRADEVRCEAYVAEFPWNRSPAAHHIDIAGQPRQPIIMVVLGSGAAGAGPAVHSCLLHAAAAAADWHGFRVAIRTTFCLPHLSCHYCKFLQVIAAAAASRSTRQVQLQQQTQSSTHGLVGSAEGALQHV